MTRWGMAATVAAVIGAASAATAAGADSITLYSGQHEQTVAQLVKDFERRTGIHVTVRSAEEGELANQLLQEGSGSPADLFYAENPPALEALSRRDLLAPVAAATLRAVPRRDSSPRGTWVGVSARSVALASNIKEVPRDRLPGSVLDLATPAWKGRIGFAPTETDFQPVVAAVAKLRGQATARRWLEGLKDNGKVYSDNESLIAAVNRGQIATGLIDHYYWYRARDEAGGRSGSRLSYFSPGDPGALVDVSGAAVLRSSEKKDLAQRFLAYLVSPAGQGIIASSESYEYPLRPGVGNPRLQRTLASLRPPRISMADLGDGRATLALLQQVGLL